MNKSFDFNQASDMDQELYQLASYDVCKGVILTPNNPAEIDKLEREIIAKFNYFKNLIKSGECTFDFIRDDILNKYGIANSKISNKKDHLKTDITDIDTDNTSNIFLDFLKEKTSTHSNISIQYLKNLTKEFLKSFIPELTNEEINIITDQNNLDQNDDKDV